MKAEREFAEQVMDLGAIVLVAMGAVVDLRYGVELQDENDKRPDRYYFIGSTVALRSDGITEIAQQIIRTVEGNINMRLRNRDVVYFNVMLPESQFDKHFSKNPNGTVSLFTDTFRQVVAKLRKEFGV